MNKPKIIIVDEEDKVVGAEEREMARKKGFLWRASVLWVFNSDGHILLARRGWKKLHDPGEWSISVAGTVDEGETYDSNLLKEAEEELGLSGIDPQKGPKLLLRHSDGSGVFAQFYFLKLDQDISDFRLPPDEVAEVKWFTIAEIERELAGSDPSFRYMRIRWPEWSKMLQDVIQKASK